MTQGGIAPGESIFDLYKRKNRDFRETVRRVMNPRTHSIFATQLFDAQQPLPLFELPVWLAPRSLHSTQHYLRISSAKLAGSYTRAAYFRRDLQTLAQLADVPTPAGPTPRQLPSGLVPIEPTKKRRV